MSAGLVGNGKVRNTETQPIPVTINPGRKAHFVDRPVDGGGSADLSLVDGSVTPVDFEIGPAAGEIWNVYNLGFSIQDTGTAAGVDFGDGAALTNGLDVITEINSTEHVTFNVKTNLEIAFLFTAVVLGSSKQFLDDANLFYGENVMLKETVLVGDSGDKIIYRVNDDLTGIDLLTSSIKYWRFVP